MKSIFFFLGGASTMFAILVSFLVGLVMGDDMKHRETIPRYRHNSNYGYRLDRAPVERGDE